jgi:hypothetical protein
MGICHPIEHDDLKAKAVLEDDHTTALENFPN